MLRNATILTLLVSSLFLVSCGGGGGGGSETPTPEPFATTITSFDLLDGESARITFSLTDPAATPRTIVVEYTLDGGGTWSPATLDGGAGSLSSVGVGSHAVTWQMYTDLGSTFASPAQVRALVEADGATVTPSGVLALPCYEEVDAVELWAAMQPEFNTSGLVASTVPADVRSASLFDAGHLPSAVRVDLNDLAGSLGSMPMDQRLVFYCTTGASAAAGARAAVQAGYTDVARYAAGFPGWKAGNLIIQIDRKAGVMPLLAGGALPVDVRVEPEFLSGSIDGAVNIDPAQNVEMELQKVAAGEPSVFGDPDGLPAEVVVFGRGGAGLEPGLVADRIAEAGFAQVYFYFGGYADYIQ